MARKRRPSFIGDESGQSFVMLVIALGVIIGVCALAIDVGQWYQTRHQAQVTADAAALAAANSMSSNGSVSIAMSTATTYASDNSLPISSSNVTIDTSAETVTVVVPTTGSGLFSAIEPSISARAVASWNGQDCTNTANNGCAFIYAGDNVCNSNTGVTDPLNKLGTINHGISITKTGTGNTTSITGDVISASNITTNTNGNPTFGAAAYSNGTTNSVACTGPTPGTPSKPYAAAFQRSIASQFPIDYRLIYSACGTTSTKFGPVTCDANGANGFPSYCTPADESVSTTPVTVGTISTDAVYCDAGSGTSSDPSTWNGTINVSSGGNATFIAGTVNFNLPSNSTLGPAANNALLAYGAECNASSPLPTTCPTTNTTTTSPVVTLTSNGNASVTGDLFAPAGVIDSGLGGTPNITGFLEGWDVVYNANGTATGEGPAVTTVATISWDQLLQ